MPQNWMDFPEPPLDISRVSTAIAMAWLEEFRRSERGTLNAIRKGLQAQGCAHIADIVPPGMLIDMDSAQRCKGRVQEILAAYDEYRSMLIKSLRQQLADEKLMHPTRWIGPLGEPK